MKFILKNRKIVLFIVTLQEAFSAIIPFFILSSFFTLLYFFIHYYNINFLYINSKNTLFLMDRFNHVSSIIANISIAYFFASRLKISQIMATFLAIASFMTITLIKNPTDTIILPYGFNFDILIWPIISTYFLKIFYHKLSLNISVADGNHHIYRHFNYLFVFIFAYFTTIMLFIFLDFSVEIIIEKFFSQINLNLPNIILLAIRDFFVQIFWFFGLHGSHMVNAIVGKNILFKEMLPNLTYAEFNRLFVLMGGAGAGVGLLISLILLIREKTLKLITKISAPFVIFNINTLLIYAFVVLNRYFILPFIFLPIINLFVAYGALQFINIHFTSYYLTWPTPIFLDAFFKTQEYKTVMLIQLSILILDTLVYLYFTKKFAGFQSPSVKFHKLLKNFDISYELKAQEGLRSFVKRQEIIEANAELDKIIHNINNNNIFIYYQPKVKSNNNKSDKFEALIRYYHDGQLTGPVFLDTLEKAGLAPVIDIYVCKKVKEDLQKWKKENFSPQISINLHPDTLNNSEIIKKIISIMKGEDIAFEIIERSFLEENGGKNLIELQNSGFKVSIDDFGAGYSSLETLSKYNIDELKLDKSLIDTVLTKKGYTICKNTTNLCHEIGTLIVAEGVETKEQLNKVKHIGADYIQGYYYSPAIPFDKVKDFSISS